MYKDDWRKLTASIFRARLKHVNNIMAVTSGTYTQENERDTDVDRINRRILVKRKFPAIFPPGGLDG